MKLVVAIAVGGAIGAVARHFASGQIMRLLGTGFPFGTLFVNVVGSFVMGALIEFMALRWSIGPELRAFLTVGILGAFTTFSTFSLDFAVLTQRGELSLALTYAVVSVVFSVGALFGGMNLFRMLLA